MFHKTFGDYYISGFVHASSYWLQCEVEDSNTHSNLNLDLSCEASGIGKVFNVQGDTDTSYSKVTKSSLKITNVIRHLKGHDLKKLDSGLIDITKGA